MSITDTIERCPLNSIEIIIQKLNVLIPLVRLHWNITSTCLVGSISHIVWNFQLSSNRPVLIHWVLRSTISTHRRSLPYDQIPGDPSSVSLNWTARIRSIYLWIVTLPRRLWKWCSCWLRSMMIVVALLRVTQPSIVDHCRDTWCVLRPRSWNILIHSNQHPWFSLDPNSLRHSDLLWIPDISVGDGGSSHWCWSLVLSAKWYLLFSICVLNMRVQLLQTSSRLRLAGSLFKISQSVSFTR